MEEYGIQCPIYQAMVDPHGSSRVCGRGIFGTGSTGKTPSGMYSVSCFSSPKGCAALISDTCSRPAEGRPLDHQEHRIATRSESRRSTG